MQKHSEHEKNRYPRAFGVPIVILGIFGVLIVVLGDFGVPFVHLVDFGVPEVINLGYFEENEQFIISKSAMETVDTPIIDMDDKHSVPKG